MLPGDVPNQFSTVSGKLHDDLSSNRLESGDRE